MRLLSAILLYNVVHSTNVKFETFGSNGLKATIYFGTIHKLRRQVRRGGGGSQMPMLLHKLM